MRYSPGTLLILFGIAAFTVNCGSLRPGHDQRLVIVVDTPKTNALVKSPLIVSGRAPSWWFFEGQAPITLKDINGKVLAQAIAHGDWQKPGLVPFHATLNFPPPAVEIGWLILFRDIEKENSPIADSVSVFVRFKP